MEGTDRTITLDLSALLSRTCPSPPVGIFFSPRDFSGNGQPECTFFFLFVKQETWSCLEVARSPLPEVIRIRASLILRVEIGFQGEPQMSRDQLLAWPLFPSSI